MTYRVGRKTKTKGWPILRVSKGNTKVIAHSKTFQKARKGIAARQAGRSAHW